MADRRSSAAYRIAFAYAAAFALAKALGELRGGNAELQRIGVEYGFRIADTAVFMQAVKPTGLAVEERITQVIDPPSFEIMAEMIDVVAREMTQ